MPRIRKKLTTPTTRGKVIMRRLDTVAPNPWNPNRMTDEMKRSMLYGFRHDGWLVSQALLIWGTDETGAAKNIIIDGEHRWLTATELNMVEGPMVVLDGIDETEAKKLTVKLNQKRGEFDDDLLADLLTTIETDRDDMALDLGFDAGILDRIFEGNSSETSANIEEGETPEPPKNPITKPGDLWVMGDHRLVCGSCRDADTVAALVDGQKVNVAFTSPPYASQRTYDDSSGFKPIKPDEYVEWFEAVQANVREVLADDGSWFVNIKEHCEDGQRSLYVKDLTLAHVRQWGWRYVDELVWKRVTVPGKWPSRFKNLWEPVFHFSASKAIKFRPDSVAHDSARTITYNASHHFGSDSGGHQCDDGSLKYNAQREGAALPGNMVECSVEEKGIDHSAPFPVRLPTFFIKAYSDPGDLIFDPFMGSGTTTIAAENEGRRSVGCELSPAYCDVIVERWENLTGGKAERP